MKIIKDMPIEKLTPLFTRILLLQVRGQRFKRIREPRGQWGVDIREDQLTISVLEDAACDLASKVKAMRSSAELPIVDGATCAVVRSRSGLIVRGAKSYHPFLGWIVRFDVAG